MYCVTRFARRVSLFALLFLCGCAAADFKEPIGTFSDATKVAASSFAEYEKLIDEQAQKRKIKSALAGQFRVVPGDCRTGRSTHCRIQVQLTEGWRSLSDEPTIPHIRKIMDGLVAYATTLNAIANADTAGKIKTAMDAAKTSVSGLAKAVDTLNAQRKQPTKLEAQVASFGSPVSDIIVFGLTKYLEHVKLDALRHATATVDPVFAQLDPIFLYVARQSVDLKLTDLEPKYLLTGNNFRKDRTAENLTAWKTATEAYDAALSLKQPGKVFVDLANAHNELTKALDSPDITIEKLWGYIQQVSDEATKLVAAVKTFEKATQSKP